MFGRGYVWALGMFGRGYVWALGTFGRWVRLGAHVWALGMFGRVAFGDMLFKKFTLIGFLFYLIH
jgi:hypothetical protein